MALKSLGMHVYVVEVDALRATEAKLMGYLVVSKREACKFGDVLVTATGCIKVHACKGFSKKD